MLTVGLALSALAFALATLLMLVTSAHHTTTIAVALAVFVLEAGAATVLPLARLCARPLAHARLTTAHPGN